MGLERHDRHFGNKAGAAQRALDRLGGDEFARTLRERQAARERGTGLRKALGRRKSRS